MEKMLQAAQNTGDYLLNYQFQKNMFLSSPEIRQEIRGIVREEISNTNVTIDAEEAIKMVNGLEDAINRLGGK